MLYSAPPTMDVLQLNRSNHTVLSTAGNFFGAAALAAGSTYYMGFGNMISTSAPYKIPAGKTFYLHAARLRYNVTASPATTNTAFQVWIGSSTGSPPQWTTVSPTGFATSSSGALFVGYPMALGAVDYIVDWKQMNFNAGSQPPVLPTVAQNNYVVLQVTTQASMTVVFDYVELFGAVV